VLKKYFNIAFAADTPNGLVVPVIKNADQKGRLRARRNPANWPRRRATASSSRPTCQGACFTISSLGGIGGTYFAPIVNAPEVAILGVNKSVMKPVWDGKQFVPRLTLPLSLTADHRVIDGALATRFNVYLAQLLADMRKVAEGTLVALVRVAAAQGASAPAPAVPVAAGSRRLLQPPYRQRRLLRLLRPPSPARPTSNAKCWCSAPAPAAIPRPSAPPTSA
jgi:hypothetical protein